MLSIQRFPIFKKKTKTKIATKVAISKKNNKIFSRKKITPRAAMLINDVKVNRYISTDFTILVIIFLCTFLEFFKTFFAL